MMDQLRPGYLFRKVGIGTGLCYGK